MEINGCEVGRKSGKFYIFKIRYKILKTGKIIAIRVKNLISSEKVEKSGNFYIFQNKVEKFLTGKEFAIRVKIFDFE